MFMADLMEDTDTAEVTMAREMLKLSQDTDMVVMVMADLMEDTGLMVDMDTAEDTMAREALMLRLLLSQDTMVVMDTEDLMEVMVDMDTDHTVTESKQSNQNAKLKLYCHFLDNLEIKDLSKLK